MRKTNESSITQSKIKALTGNNTIRHDMPCSFPYTSSNLPKRYGLVNSRPSFCTQMYA